MYENCISKISIDLKAFFMRFTASTLPQLRQVMQPFRRRWWHLIKSLKSLFSTGIRTSGFLIEFTFTEQLFTQPFRVFPNFRKGFSLWVNGISNFLYKIFLILFLSEKTVVFIGKLCRFALNTQAPGSVQDPRIIKVNWLCVDSKNLYVPLSNLLARLLGVCWFLKFLN